MTRPHALIPPPPSRRGCVVELLLMLAAEFSYLAGSLYAHKRGASEASSTLSTGIGLGGGNTAPQESEPFASGPEPRGPKRL